MRDNSLNNNDDVYISPNLEVVYIKHIYLLTCQSYFKKVVKRKKKNE